MTATTPAGRPAPPRRMTWLSVAQTGWAARQATRHDSEAAHDCGAVPCPTSDPHLAGDCRRTI